jgi:hypothetical protein
LGTITSFGKSPAPEWGVKEAVQRLIEMAELLLNILHQRNEPFGQFTSLAERHAADFWKLTSHSGTTARVKR